MSLDCLQLAITTPEGGSRGYPYILIQDVSLQIIHPPQKGLATLPEVYVPYSFRTVVWVLLRPTRRYVKVL